MPRCGQIVQLGISNYQWHPDVDFVIVEAVKDRNNSKWLMERGPLQPDQTLHVEPIKAMSNKHDYPPMKLGPPPHKLIMFLAALVLALVLVALFVCLITHNWTWELFGKAIAIQVIICYVVGEIYFAFRPPW